MIGIVDLDMGNLRSVANAVDACGFETRVVGSMDGFDELTHLILPGVGSYAVAMERMGERALEAPIHEFARSGRPVLGICLGMQLLSTSGAEGRPTLGLGLIPGTVERFEEGSVPAIPHVGWNEARRKRSHPVLRRVKSGVDFYYVHSYRFICAEESDVICTVEYGGFDHASIVGRNNAIGFQFHPEKSQASGLRLLENFCRWDGRC